MPELNRLNEVLGFSENKIVDREDTDMYLDLLIREDGSKIAAINKWDYMWDITEFYTVDNEGLLGVKIGESVG